MGYRAASCIILFHLAARFGAQGITFEKITIFNQSPRICPSEIRSTTGPPAERVEFRTGTFFHGGILVVVESHERKLTNWLTRDNITGRSGRIASHYVIQLPPPVATSLHCAPCWPPVIATLYLCEPLFFTSLPESLANFQWPRELRAS